MGRKRKIDFNKIISNSNNDSSNYNLFGAYNMFQQTGRTRKMSETSNGVQRTAANDRERTRMRVLSRAFVKLKSSLPWVPSDTKLSKLDTLKLATSYISYLTRVLEDDSTTNIELNSSYCSNINKPPLNAHCSNISFTNLRFLNADKSYKKMNSFITNQMHQFALPTAAATASAASNTTSKMMASQISDSSFVETMHPNHHHQYYEMSRTKNYHLNLVKQTFYSD